MFRIDVRGSLDRYHSYFSERFLPRDVDSLPSLVCETEHGRILGFLGVGTRHFSLGGRTIRAALSSQFVVHPEGRCRFIGVQMLREYLAGRQDMSFTDEANAMSQRLWVGLGGSVSPLQGIHWIVPLRPVRLACHRYIPAWAAQAISGAANLLDRVTPMVKGYSCSRNSSGLTSEPLSTKAMLACLNEATRQCELRPQYDCRSLDVLIEQASEKTKHGPLRRILLRDRMNQVAGWYLYHCKAGGLAEVLQIGYRENCPDDVVQHLAADARSHGATAVVGRLEPGLAQPLADRFCLLFRRKNAFLVHSRYPEILSAIQSGSAFISRLEGEWCLRFS